MALRARDTFGSVTISIASAKIFILFCSFSDIFPTSLVMLPTPSRDELTIHMDITAPNARQIYGYSTIATAQPIYRVPYRTPMYLAPFPSERQGRKVQQALLQYSQCDQHLPPARHTAPTATKPRKTCSRIHRSTRVSTHDRAIGNMKRSRETQGRRLTLPDSSAISASLERAVQSQENGHSYRD